ncbi:response regulator transcription factor [Mycoplasmatota bacterium WC44]
MSFNILIIESDLFINSVLNRTLKLEGFKLHDTFDRKTAVDVINNNDYNLVIIGFKTKDEDITEIIKLAKERNPNSGIIVMGEQYDRELLLRYYELGIDDFMLKPFDIDLFVAKVNALKRRMENTNLTRRIGDIEIDYGKQLITCNSISERLNPTEFRIIFKLVTSYIEDKVLDKEEVNKLLFHSDNKTGPNGAKVYIYRLRDKLNKIGSKGVEIKNDYGTGYYLVVNNE